MNIYKGFTRLTVSSFEWQSRTYHSFRMLSMCHQKEKKKSQKSEKVSDLIVKDPSHLVLWERRLSEVSRRQRTLYNFI